MARPISSAFSSRRDLLRAGAGGLAATLFPIIRGAWASSPPADFAAALAAAKGQEVYFNAWGGDQRINDYIAWAGAEIERRFGVKLIHVKLADTAEAVNRVLGEKAAGRMEGGSVDLIWINGENFAAMKTQNLLFGPITPLLPSMAFVDPIRKPSTIVDFTVPTDGFEVPWGMAQLVFFHDSLRLPEPPRSFAALADWAKAKPGRFTYPLPPDFIGTTFLKQALIQIVGDAKRLAMPAIETDIDVFTAPLWAYLDELHPYLWQKGRAFPPNSADLRQLLGDGEVDISMAFNPGDASSAIAQNLLPDTVRSFVFAGGSIGNTHFLAVPFNAKAAEGALVVAEFLLSPEAQARKQDPAIWGDPTVLEIDLLAEADRARFAALPLGIATLPPEKLGPILPEPHPSWVEAIESRWIRRYAG